MAEIIIICNSALFTSILPGWSESETRVLLCKSKNHFALTGNAQIANLRQRGGVPVYAGEVVILCDTIWRERGVVAIEGSCRFRQGTDYTALNPRQLG